MRVFIISFLWMVMSLGHASAEMRIEQIGADLSHPWGMDFISDNAVLVTTRPGKLYRISLDTGTSTQIGNLPDVAHYGQGGLLDVATDGDEVFLCYAKPTKFGAATAIDKARLSGDQLSGRMTIFTSNSRHDTAHHFGCRLVLASGALYASLGDRGHRFHAQKPQYHDGSILRLLPDGRPHPDNPKLAGWQEESFTIGHRNPQGLAAHPETGAIWAHEHGPQGGDEINLLQKGQNYGWPVVSFGKEYGTDQPVSNVTSRPDMADPLWVWVPSIAPSGMAFYPKEAKMFPELQGSLLIGSLKFKQLYQVRLDTTGMPIDETVILDKTLGRIRDVAVARDGSILVLNDANSRTKPVGGLYRITR